MTIRVWLGKMVLSPALVIATHVVVLAENYTPELHDPRRSINGVLTESQGGILTVETIQGESWKFTVPTETEIAVNGVKAEEGKLSPGMNVAVTPSREEPSRASSIVATSIKEKETTER